MPAATIDFVPDTSPDTAEPPTPKIDFVPDAAGPTLEEGDRPSPALTPDFEASISPKLRSPKVAAIPTSLISPEVTQYPDLLPSLKAPTPWYQRPAIEALSKPLAEVVPKVTSADLLEQEAGGRRLLSAVAKPFVGEEAAEKLRDIPKGAIEYARESAGVEQSLADAANFFTSPIGIATLGMGSLPVAAQRTVALVFAAQMAQQVPEIASQLGDELGKPPEQRDPTKIAKLITDGITTTGFTVAGALHGLKPGAPTPTPKVERTPDAISQRSELTPIQEPGTLERASREPIDVQTGTQAESGIKGEAAPDDPKAIIRRQETTDNWLKAIAGNDPEKIRNAQEKLFGTQVDPQERQTILDDLNRARQAVRAPSDIRADVGQTALEEGARTPQERERTGQQAGESGIDDPLKSLKASLESSKSDGWEAATGTVGEALRLLQDLSDPKKQARSAGNLLRMLQEELPEVPKETADRIKKEIYGSIQLRIAKKVPLEVSPGDRQAVVEGVRAGEEPPLPQEPAKTEDETQVEEPSTPTAPAEPDQGQIAPQEEPAKAFPEEQPGPVAPQQEPAKAVPGEQPGQVSPEPQKAEEGLLKRASGLSSSEFFDLSQSWQQEAMGALKEGKKPLTVQERAEQAARDNPDLGAWKKAKTDADAESKAVSHRVKKAQAEIDAKSKAGEITGAQRKEQTEKLYMDNQKAMFGAGQKSQFFGEGLKILEGKETTKTPAKSVPQKAGKGRMSAEEVTKAVKEKHPNARIEVVDDPSADWNGQYTQDANGNFTGIKINSAFISSPAELAHVLEHEIAHGADFQKITRDLTPHLSEGEWSGILKDISHYPTGEMSWEVRARAIQKLADAWRGRSWFDKLVGHAQRVAEKLGFKTTRLGAERMAADGLAKAARSIEEAKGTSEGIEAKSRPAPEGEPGKEPEITGIAERISTARTAAGRIGEIEPGEGIAPKDAVEIGRGLMASGVDPVAAVNEAINSGKIDADIFPLARAQEEKLAQAAVDAERQFGRNSPEYREASQKDTDWLRKVKQLQTVWAQAGHGQQGGVEIDTGTFHGLARAHREATGKDFTPQQAQNADALANRGAQADQVAQNAAQAAVEHIDKEIGETRSQNPEQRALDAAHKTVREWAAKKAELENKVRVAEQARQTALDKMEQDRQDRAAKSARETGAAIAKAEAENKARVDKAEQDRAAAQAEVERTRRAMQSADRTVRAAAAMENAQAQTKLRVAEQARRTALEKMQRDREARAGKQAQDVTQSQAEAKADAENRERVLKAQQAKTAAEAERARTQAALDAASKAVREAAARAAKAETDKRVAKANKAKFIWDHIKDSDYLDPKDGNADFDDVVNKTATDLGMTPDEVRKSLAVSRVGKRMMDEMYAKMAERRRIKTQAMVWLRSLETPAWARFVKSVPRAFFAAKVFGHGTVGMITHAGINIFDPAAWRTYWPNFIRQYSFVFKKGAHEAAMQDLVRDPNYTMWKRAGLQVDPFKFSDDYQNATMRSFMNKLGGLVGNRGFDALKTFRMARANQIWNRLSLKMQTPEMAQAIADSVNHATGVVKMPFRDWTALALFAPKLEASRWAFMIGDPAKAARIFLKGADATPAERHFAMSELRQKATIAGVYVSLLAVNQGLLTAMGSDQQVNMTDPIKSDYLSFKVAGHNLGIVGPMIGMVKLFGKLYHDTRGERTKLERLTPRWREAASDIGQYGRSKFSPFSGEVANVVTGSDFMGKPLPFSEDRMPSGLRRRGEEPYTWPEYVLSGATPIPIEEMLKEIWTDQGMSRSKAETTLRALGTLVTASTGARLSPDYEVQR